MAVPAHDIVLAAPLHSTDRDLQTDTRFAGWSRSPWKKEATVPNIIIQTHPAVREEKVRGVLLKRLATQ
jgi:hypothetical protein